MTRTSSLVLSAVLVLVGAAPCVLALPPTPHYVPVAGLWSNLTPDPDQHHRSSGNFNTQNLPSPDGQTCSVYMKAGGEDFGAGIHFDIMHDCSSCKDKVIDSDVYDAKVISFFGDRNLYVANPSGARDIFFVEFIGQYNDGQIPMKSGTTSTSDPFPTDLLGFALSLTTTQPGQNHRSSGNFTTRLPHDPDPKGLRWEIRWAMTDVDPWNAEPANDVQVDIKVDRSAAVDPTPWPGIQHGGTTGYTEYRRIYVANPSRIGGGTLTGSFWVLVYQTN